MKRKQFVFFASFLDAVENLPLDQRGAFFDAVVQYSLRGTEPEFDQNFIVSKAVFTAIKPVLDMSINRSKAGKAGGEKKAKRKQNVSKGEAKRKQNVSKGEAIGKERIGRDRIGVDRSGVENTKKQAKKSSLQKPDNFSESEFKDLIAHRKELKTPLTARALAGITKQFTLSGLSVSDCIDEMANRGWKGFKAEWVKKDGKNKNGRLGYVEPTADKDYSA